MTIIDLANNDDAYILPPIYIVPLLPPFKCHCPSIYFFPTLMGGGVNEGWMLHQGGVVCEGGCESGWL